MCILRSPELSMPSGEALKGRRPRVAPAPLQLLQCLRGSPERNHAWVLAHQLAESLELAESQSREPEPGQLVQRQPVHFGRGLDQPVHHLLRDHRGDSGCEALLEAGHWFSPRFFRGSNSYLAARLCPGFPCYFSC